MDKAPRLSNDIKAEIRHRYDEFAAVELEQRGLYEELGPAKMYFRSRKLAAALQMARFGAGTELLEIGSSVGQFSFALARQGYRVTAVDLSPNAVEVGQRRAQAANEAKVQFTVGDAEDLRAFDQNTFDGVVSFSTLRYVPRVANALKEIRRVLKPGAIAVFDFPNRWCPWFYLKAWLGSERHPGDHHYSAREVRALVREAGLSIVEVRHLLFTPTVAPDAAVGAFKILDTVGEQLPLVSRLAGIIMVAARK